MSQLRSLCPTERRLVMDLLQEAGVDVADWANYAGKSPAANPKYCYDWAFIQPDRVVVLNLWHDAMLESDGIITIRDNMRRQAERYARRPDKSTWRRRSEKMDQAVRYAYSKRLPIRVVVLDGRKRAHEDMDSKASQVETRMLDPVPWAVTAYDEHTGHFTLTRGALPGRLVDQFALGGSPDSPTEVRPVSGTDFVRSAIVRKHALDRADGRCEWCGEFGFATHDGAIFLETHHVVPLSEGGPDKASNVVALCPNHHREAHFGASHDGMRESLLRKLADSATARTYK